MSEKLPLVNVMFPTGKRTNYDITKDTTAGDLIKMITEDSSVSHPENRTVAIIYHGRILNPSEIIVKIDTLDEFTIHVFYRAIPQPHAAPAAPVEELKGFDRLRRMNYERGQIEEIRRNFHVMQGTVNASQEERMEAEEEWFPVLFNQENPLQDLQLPPPRRQRSRQRNEEAENNPLANPTEAEVATTDFFFESASWVRVAFGLIIGSIFGIGSLVFMLISFHDKSFVLGLVIGTCAHYGMEYYLDLN